MKYNNILETIGSTPVIKLNRIGSELPCELWVKLELFNPAGSVKDRPALKMIEDAERDGRLKPGDTIIEPTSGNTGIGLAMVAAVKGYRAVFTMSADMSQERKLILQAYGGELILTPAEKGTVGAIEEAKKLAAEKGYFFVGQHYNASNPAAHERTAHEIWQDFGESLDTIVTTTGTGGTVSGVSKYLKQLHSRVEIVATEPADTPLLSQGIEKAGKHKIMGTAPGFYPDTLDLTSFDKVLQIKWQRAYQMAREAARKEGILCGISCGAAIDGMLQLAAQPEYAGKTILAMLADSGERYLSTDLYTADLKH